MEGMNDFELLRKVPMLARKLKQHSSGFLSFTGWVAT